VKNKIRTREKKENEKDATDSFARHGWRYMNVLTD